MNEKAATWLKLSNDLDATNDQIRKLEDHREEVVRQKANLETEMKANCADRMAFVFDGQVVTVQRGNVNVFPVQK